MSKEERKAIYVYRTRDLLKIIEEKETTQVIHTVA